VKDFPVIVLAGGEGSRIGGNKPWRMIGGETLLARAVRKARRWSPDVHVSVREGSGYSGDMPLLRDEPAVPGPLGGLAAGLRLTRQGGREAVLILPCDMPFLPDDLADRLGGEMDAKAVALAESGGQLHPVCGVWRAQALDRLDEYLGSGRRSLRGFAATLGYAAIVWSAGPPDPFFNINSEDDLRQAEAIVRLWPGLGAG
jgi:molybdopterin-guanine dinucleotide biosynthesis protein A